MKPEYLYHYTNIEALALILRNHSIRFNSLDKMDDLQEKESSDIRNAGRFVYVSSWTDEEEESIPMWNMYASLEQGVRVKLKSNPFMHYTNCIGDIVNVTNFHVNEISDLSKEFADKSIISWKEMFSEGFFASGVMDGDFLQKVEYNDDLSKLYPTLLNFDGKNYTLNLGNLGKNKYWSFQKEWRYIFQAFPINLNQPPEKSGNEAQQMFVDIINGVCKHAFDYYDMKLEDAAYSEMEIMLSPRISLGNRVIVESLVEKYNPSATLIDSNLVGLI